jgi:hypothetical protein
MGLQRVARWSEFRYPCARSNNRSFSHPLEESGSGCQFLFSTSAIRPAAFCINWWCPSRRIRLNLDLILTSCARLLRVSSVLIRSFSQTSRFSTLIGGTYCQTSLPVGARRMSLRAVGRMDKKVGRPAHPNRTGLG